jgi:hypothetical protein
MDSGLTRRLATAVIVLTAGTTASAQTNVCLDLQSRLLAVESGTFSDDRLRQREAQLGKQRAELDRAMADARKAGCVGGLVIFRRPDRRCGRLTARINRLQANLTRLSFSLDRGDPFALARQRNEILQALAANRCNTGFGSLGAPTPGFFATLFEGLGGQGMFGGQGFGTYRTLCVRMCDGYYFPISFSTVPAKFAADEQVCRATCPGADVQLFTHRNPGEESEAMVSLAGEPYGSLPAAFQYRTKYDPSCTCRAKPGSEPLVTTLAGDDPDQLASVQPDVTPVPSPRPAAGEDPETLANRAGVLRPGAIRLSDEQVGDGPGGKTVRIVGPSYYYAQ